MKRKKITLIKLNVTQWRLNAVNTLTFGIRHHIALVMYAVLNIVCTIECNLNLYSMHALIWNQKFHFLLIISKIHLTAWAWAWWVNCHYINNEHIKTHSANWSICYIFQISSSNLRIWLKLTFEMSIVNNNEWTCQQSVVGSIPV